MMMNRAGWLALFVLGIATLLMVFFVLPRVTDSVKAPGEMTTDATGEARNAVAAGKGTAPEISGEAASQAAEAMQKLGRLSQQAQTAISQLSAPFANNGVPADQVFAAARENARVAIAAISSLDIPKTLDSVTTALITTARDRAVKALTLLQSLPREAAAAAPQITRLSAIIAGTDDGAIAPAQTPSPSASAAPTLATPSDVPAVSPDITVKPAFDVLRVEPDGSTVIAGTAQPGTTLEVMNGNIAVAKSQVGSAGDFAAILDLPLAPGEHQLVLKSTGPNGQAVMSDEIATVSVPPQKNGELLAMVSKPGKASRVLAMPAAPSESPEPSMPSATPDSTRSTGNEQGVVAPQQAAALASSDTEAGHEAGKPIIRVTAVEIEKDKLFVAGTAPAGATIIAYADDILIGQAMSEKNGHFVVDGTRELSVGSHVIRADLVDSNGKVVVRVSVPFDRPHGEQVAVTAAEEIPAGAAPLGPIDAAVYDKLKTEALRAFGIMQGLYRDNALPSVDQLAAARSGLGIALKSLTEFRIPAELPGNAVEIMKRFAQNASSLLKQLDAMPKDVKGFGEKIGDLSDAMARTFGQLQEAPAPADTNAPKTISQAPLTENRNAVIIRRGDTLWQISRRVYGQGVRYTTIYLANQNAINNPDRIQPGQIFGVPDEALPNAEELHRKRMSGRPG